MIQLSTGLKNAVLSGGSLKATMDLGFLKVYGGTVPAGPDASIGGATLLCTVSINSGGTGISFDTAAAGGILSKPPAAVWSGVNAASGSATFYRHVAVGDDGAASTTQARIQGLVGQVASDMNLSAGVALTTGVTLPIDSYLVAIP